MFLTVSNKEPFSRGLRHICEIGIPGQRHPSTFTPNYLLVAQKT